MIFVFRNSVFLVVALLLASPAAGQMWDEISNGGGDAGDFPTGSCQFATDSMVYNRIQGELLAGDADAFSITIENATWSADVVSGTASDTRLWLFDLDGNFLMGNDDSSPTGGAFASFLSDTSSFGSASDDGNGTLVHDPTDPAVGQQVVLVITGYPDDALDTAGNPLTDMENNFDALIGIDPGSTGAFGSWQGFAAGGGTYDIVLSGARLTSVPEPTAICLLALGLVGFTLRRRR